MGLPKTLWRWKIREFGVWVSYPEYIDEKGKNSAGHKTKFFYEWASLEKEKVEGDSITVDEKGRIIHGQDGTIEKQN